MGTHDRAKNGWKNRPKVRQSGLVCPPKIGPLFRPGPPILRFRGRKSTIFGPKTQNLGSGTRFFEKSRDFPKIGVGGPRKVKIGGPGPPIFHFRGGPRTPDFEIAGGGPTNLEIDRFSVTKMTSKVTLFVHKKNTGENLKNHRQTGVVCPPKI